MTDSAPDPTSSIPVRHLLTATVEADNFAMLRSGPFGPRFVLSAHGRFAGERLRGEVLGSPGGEWGYGQIFGSPSTRAVQRWLLKTDDGSHILLEFRHIHFSERPQRIRATGWFETELDDERYAWINDVSAIGYGGIVDENSPTAAWFRFYEMLDRPSEAPRGP